MLFLVTLADFAQAATGTINSVSKYAWGENIGWVNFGAPEGNVTVTDTELTGYAWGENIGWISLNCSNTSSCGTVDYKISNTTSGALSGYAWSENAGWINFAPGFGVNPTIDSDGEFQGLAWGENIGWINFNCDYASTCATVDFKVKTGWLPAGGGGGGTNNQVSSPASSPAGTSEPTSESSTAPVPPPATPELPEEIPPGPPETSPPSEPPSGTMPTEPPPGGSPPTWPDAIIAIPEAFVDVVKDIQHAIVDIVPKIAQQASRPISIVSGVGVAISGGASAVAMASSGLNFFTYAEFFLKNVLIFFGLKKRARTWGTVYNSRTKQPLPFTKIHLIGQDARVLETRITDRDGRYGFLINAAGVHSSATVALRLLPVRDGFTFPSQKITRASDTVLYDHIYHGDMIEIHTRELVRFDIPMDPMDNGMVDSMTRVPRIHLHNFIAALSHVMFWIALVALPLNAIFHPTVLNLVMLVVFMLLNLVIIIGDLQQRPYGLVLDRLGGVPVPYSLITLQDPQGARRGFTVSDEQGRYFLLSEKGNFTITTHTPAHISPPRSEQESLQTDRGWIAKKLNV